ncbi:hypothetical protein JCM10207_002344 [Rhodosporidiobolus poonsookiae]
MAGLPPPVLDPYPAFHLARLPSLNNLDSLHSYQLALVPFHPESTPEQRNRARALFQRRRMEGMVRREEVGRPEKDAELRQLHRARDWLAGVVPGSRPMRDADVATDEPEPTFTSGEVRERVRKVSALAVERALQDHDEATKKVVEAAIAAERIKAAEERRLAVEQAIELQKRIDRMAQERAVAAAVEQAQGKPAEQAQQPLVPHPAATTPQSSPEEALENGMPAGGPFFDFHSTNPRPIPRDLINLFHIVLCTGLSERVTPCLLFHYMTRYQRASVPRPLALHRSQSGSIMIAFRSQEAAEEAVRQLDGKGMLLAQCKISARIKTNQGNEFRWRDCSLEVQEQWSDYRRLPLEVWAMKALPAAKGVSVSVSYQKEWDRIKRAEKERDRQESAQMSEGEGDEPDSPAPQYDYYEPAGSSLPYGGGVLGSGQGDNGLYGQSRSFALGGTSTSSWATATSFAPSTSRPQPYAPSFTSAASFPARTSTPPYPSFSNLAPHIPSTAVPTLHGRPVPPPPPPLQTAAAPAPQNGYSTYPAYSSMYGAGLGGAAQTRTSGQDELTTDPRKRPRYN